MLHAKMQTEISNIWQGVRISKFSEIEILHHLDEQKMAITRLILKIDGYYRTGLIFYIQAKFLWRHLKR